MANLQDAFSAHGIPLTRASQPKATVALAEPTALPPSVPYQTWSLSSASASSSSSSNASGSVTCGASEVKVTGRRWVIELEAQKSVSRYFTNLCQHTNNCLLCHSQRIIIWHHHYHLYY
jgi:hypothetical protein